MSQHYYCTATASGQYVRVTLGFDRPIGHYFMTVERIDAPAVGDDTDEASRDTELDDEEDNFMYSNLDERTAFDNSLAYYRAKLVELGIEVPSSMFEELERDKRENVGNRYVWHRPDGKFLEHRNR